MRTHEAKGFVFQQGNTAVYLLYTHARVSSILARADEQVLAHYHSQRLLQQHSFF
jgi:arginyl-tRNA synthetase